MYEHVPSHFQNFEFICLNFNLLAERPLKKAILEDEILIWKRNYITYKYICIIITIVSSSDAEFFSMINLDVN